MLTVRVVSTLIIMKILAISLDAIAENFQYKEFINLKELMVWFSKTIGNF